MTMFIGHNFFRLSFSPRLYLTIKQAQYNFHFRQKINLPNMHQRARYWSVSIRSFIIYILEIIRRVWILYYFVFNVLIVSMVKEATNTLGSTPNWTTLKRHGGSGEVTAAQGQVRKPWLPRGSSRHQTALRSCVTAYGGALGSGLCRSPGCRCSWDRGPGTTGEAQPLASTRCSNIKSLFEGAFYKGGRLEYGLHNSWLAGEKLGWAFICRS